MPGLERMGGMDGAGETRGWDGGMDLSAHAAGAFIDVSLLPRTMRTDADTKSCLRPMQAVWKQAGTRRAAHEPLQQPLWFWPTRSRRRVRYTPYLQPYFQPKVAFHLGILATDSIDLTCYC